MLPGKTADLEQWPAFLNQNMDAVVQTLQGENLLVVTILHGHLDGEDFLCRFGIQFEGGIDVRDSQHPVDAKPLDRRRECLDDSHAHVAPGPAPACSRRPSARTLGAGSARKRKGTGAPAGRTVTGPRVACVTPGRLKMQAGSPGG
ncbi:hypothetical protein DQ353_18820 [Arthrobacter sp. AQ5-05]|nr:hypothetical protein DQ353_18820 [Arthrobacter sp. AQ5-05]